MPAYKEENGTWTSKFKYRNWLGEYKQKTKRGFARKKDALDFEATFKANYIRSANIPFDELDIRNWQNWVRQKGYEKKPDVGYAPTYLKSINNEMSAVMNYAVRYYKLPDNPCVRAGSMGKGSADAMQIWTLDQFELFISAADKTDAKIAFDILFWTGIREGELLALTPADFLPGLKLSITKSFAVVEGEHIIKDPKTENSNRTIAIPEFLYNEVQEFTKSFLLYEVKRMAKAAGLDPIRVHDFRHSHASLLIEMGFNILAVSERLGHKDVKTTWNTYAHLYPDKGRQIAFGLQEVKLSGITSNQTAEDQVLSLLGAIQKMLPNYNTYETDDIILWDRVEKKKEIITREQFNELANYEMEPAEAFVIMMQDGYFVNGPSEVFCFSSRGMPVEYL